MENNIELSKDYIPTLDEVYKQATTSSVLNSPEKDIKMGQKAGEFLVAKYSMDGLKDYSRNSGYKKGNVKLEWETHKANYDRGVKFEVDTMDDEESGEIAFGKLAGEFARTQAGPEEDAFTYSTLAGQTGVTITEEELTTGDDVLSALQREQNAMDEEEVNSNTRILFITPTALRKAKNVEKYKSTGVLDEFMKIQRVPQKRFYTAIELLDGETDNELAGGYKKATTGKDINFMIVEKSAVLKWPKRKASNIIVPENNPDSDAYIQKNRNYGIVDAYENKIAGIRVSANKA